MEMKKIVFFILLISSFLYFLWLYPPQITYGLLPIQVKDIHMESTQCMNYKSECVALFKKLRFPNQSLIIRPPLKLPPADLYKEFTQNGEMPITKEFYFDEVYSDSNSNDKQTNGIVTAKEFDEWLARVRANEPLNYANTELEFLMKKNLNQIKNQSLVVIGTQLPWIEAIGYELSASQIITLDYTRKKYEYNRLEWLHVNDYLDDLIQNRKQFEQFNNAASFSSIEHSGLGRYGDPLSPNGDIDAVRQVHCMLKPNGLFFLGLPTSSDNSSYIEFNAHRVYGYKRLRLLFDGWTKLDQKSCADFHSIFVLKKNSFC